MKLIDYLVWCCACTIVSEMQAQPAATYAWHDPAEAKVLAIEGQAWPGEVENTYDRLPARAKPLVRDEIWDLGRHAAGEYIRFSTSSNKIAVRYMVDGNLAFPHMPATGVSGVDLYAKDKAGRWQWASGKYKFGDTIEYRFSNLDVNGITEFRLYLPLYNNVKWLTIGVGEEAKFAFLPKQKEKPVVVYGSSIAQGGCATRPGMAWTGILNRLLDRSIINLGFSGNGHLEKPVLELMNEIDASVYVLDCLPNLVDRSVFPPEEVKRLIINAVTVLRDKHPQTPILLVEHATTLPFSNMDTGTLNRYSRVNVVSAEAFAAIQQKGFKNIYLLTAKEMALNTESTVDGSHPNDLGMMEYARAYAKKLKPVMLQK
ncbi:MAG: SGNH/GDSL hydrolase family protein [Chitinophagaceae bacterium]|nr:SGNH/GDSL hydrolase family protein [Chitinophagaceae bacterium]